MCEDGPQLSDLSTMNLETADKEVAEGVLSGKVTEVVKNKVECISLLLTYFCK